MYKRGGEGRGCPKTEESVYLGGTVNRGCHWGPPSKKKDWGKEEHIVIGKKMGYEGKTKTRNGLGRGGKSGPVEGKQ